MKKSIALILCIVLVVASLMMGGWSKGSKDNERLVIWSFMNEGEPGAVWEQGIVDKYCELYPDVDVEIVYCGRDILTQYQAKKGDVDSEDYPDIISQGTSTMLPLAEDGIFYCLDDALETNAFESETKWKDTFLANFMDSIAVDGKAYSIPESIYVHGFFYDEVMFEKLGLTIPTTWDELVEVCETLKANGIAPVALDGSLDVYNGWWFARFATRLAGFEALNEAAQGNISWKDNEAFLKAAEYIQYFVDHEYFQKGYEGSVFPAAQAQFTQGNCGMLLCGAWIPTEMASQTPATMKMNMFTVPEFPDSVSPWHEEIWGNVFAITADAHNKENAVEFLKIFSSMEEMSGRVAIKSPAPLVGAPSVAEVSELETIVSNATSTSTNYGGLMSYGEWYNNILGPLSTKLLCGNLTAEQFIEQLDIETQSYYSK